ncbi:hypothetical protein HIM_06623 [Hirsutella minnesotensis 3608]|uniref:Uncharacterized protein n=1 Tax=Hirsutella minnesotensis 3608 TaxID=1043627 RepID=A0A0F7ZNL4_9HYPO|nr:hypothetical protein HIM_06623 [Hirsutella minnesotensis 3608]
MKGGRTKKTSDKHRSSKHRASQPFSFLFVVNELRFYTSDHCDIHRDMWLNVLPPRDNSEYAGEIASRVMRFQNGEVTEARGYQWYRSEMRSEGSCFSQGGQWLQRYSHFAVFSCNPHLPLVVVPGDPLTTSPGGPEQPMHALLFFHSSCPELRGVSQATTLDGNTPWGGTPLKYVAGRDPSWMPGLVPAAYANPRPGAPASRGLGGELPIVLGLMAFSGSPGRADEVYLGRSGHRGLWRDQAWAHNRPPAQYPSSTQEVPCGFYVAVFLDPQNPTGSTPDLIRSFEWDGPIVRESASGSGASSSSKR